MSAKSSKIILVGDSYGLPMLLEVVPNDLIAGIVVAKIRPDDLAHVKKIAVAADKPLLIQPRKLDPEYLEFISSLKALTPNLLICNSYSMILNSDVLNIVHRNAFNVHSALLPKNRGPNPIQWALIKGESKTGVTVHVMTDELDAGDIVEQMETIIEEDDTWVTLREKLEIITKTLLKKITPEIVSQQYSKTPQNILDATVNSRLNPESPKIDFSKMSNLQIFNLIRAQVSPLKGAFLDHRGTRIYFPDFIPSDEIKILRIRYSE